MKIELDGETYRYSQGQWYPYDSSDPVEHELSVRLDAILGARLARYEQNCISGQQLVELASRWRQKGFLNRALALLDRLETEFPSYTRTGAVMRSSIYRDQGEPKLALLVTEPFLHDNDPAVFTTRAGALCDLERWEEAKRTVGRALGILKGASHKAEAFAVVSRIKSVRPDLYK